MTPKINRRKFLLSSATIVGAASLIGSRFQLRAIEGAEKACATVPLGKTGLRCSRIGFGTGTIGGSVQRALGYDGFNELFKYAFDQGINYIDTAVAYGTHDYVRRAIKGIPRERLFIQTKIPGVPANPLDVIDRCRKELDTDYIDSCLVHVATSPNWTDERKPVIDALLQAREKGWVKAIGVSCHSLPALKLATETEWVQIHLVRINHRGQKIDTPVPRWDAPSNESHVPAVVEQLKLMHEKGRGVIGMKIMGEGVFNDPETRARSIEFVMGLGTVDVMVIGFKNADEINEAIKNTVLAISKLDAKSQSKP